MLNQLFHLVVVILASMLVMILHELPKAIIYTQMTIPGISKSRLKIYRLHHYIDPIGLIFCITNFAGFSKPYMYRINDKKTNRVVGITGFVSLAVIFIISTTILNSIDVNIISTLENIKPNKLFFEFFLFYVATLSISMFFVNLFPLSTFDMGLLIASKSSRKYFSLISKDYSTKMILVLVILFGVVSNLTSLIISAFLFT